jgi:hypothetical protein
VPHAEFSDPQSLNLYSYVRNRPTVTIDPDGHQQLQGATTLDTALTVAVACAAVEPCGVGAVLAGGAAAPVLATVVAVAVPPTAIGDCLGGDCASYYIPPPPLTTTNPGQTGTPDTTGTNVQTGTPASTLQAGTVNTTPLQSTKSTTPVGTTSSGQATNAYGEKLGPSGKPARHSKQHSTRKAAKDAARQEGKGAPEEHGGDGHFHPTDKNGEKLPNETHHEYPH